MSNMQIFFVAANPKQSFFRWMLQLSLKKLLQYTWVLSLESWVLPLFFSLTRGHYKQRVLWRYSKGYLDLALFWILFHCGEMLQHWCMTVQLATQFCNQTEELAPHNNFIFNPNNVSNHQLTGKGCYVLAFMHQFCTLQNKRLKSLVIGNEKKNKATCTCDTTEDRKKTFVNSANAQHLHCFYL